MTFPGKLMARPILIPLLNPNEPEALLVELYVSEKQAVRQGDLLCTLETTKSTAELLAEADGYLLGLRVQAGQTLRAGDLLGYLAETLDEAIESTDSVEQAVSLSNDTQALDGLRITQPALLLARQHQLDLDQLPKDMIITEKWIQELLKDKRSQVELGTPGGPFDPTAILVYGGGGHGKAVIELLRAMGIYRLVGVVDDGLTSGETILGLPVLGGKEVLEYLHSQGVHLAANAVGGIGNLVVRIQVFERLAQAGFALPALVHPTACVERSASLAAGVHIFPLAYVGSEARLGYGSIVNTGAIVSHDCSLGDYVNISPGAILAGEVQVGSGALVGMGVTINLRVKIGPRARIGNGATIKNDVPAQGIVRAGSIWPG